MLVFFCFRHKTAYELLISDWSSDVCSSDLQDEQDGEPEVRHRNAELGEGHDAEVGGLAAPRRRQHAERYGDEGGEADGDQGKGQGEADALAHQLPHGHAIGVAGRSEEHTSELQSLMRISYAVFCLKKKTKPYKTR